MATKAQIDAGIVVLVAALDARDETGKDISLYNGGVVPAWNLLKDRINGGLPDLRALGLDVSAVVTPLTQVVNGINPAGKVLRTMLNQILAMVPDDVPLPPTNLEAKVG